MDPTIIAGLATAAALAMVVLATATFALARWLSFESRIDRRRKRRERFQESWGAMLRDAELAVRNSKDTASVEHR
jgi:Tfp pilus assembly protein PilX